MDQAESGVHSSEHIGSVTVLPVGSCHGLHFKEAIEVTTLSSRQPNKTLPQH